MDKSKKEKVRLDKFLATAGYGSRKDIKKIVRQGHVAVNGQTVTDSSFHVSPEADRVTVNGATVVYKQFVYLMMNKPAGYISATEDVAAPTVIELVPEEYAHYNLFPVGRLDKDTEGLLLLTNDGRLAHKLLAPKKHVPRTYFVRIEGLVTEEHVKVFSRGVTLDDGYVTKPAELKILSSASISEVELTIYEGRFHQVKRMFKSLGMKVLYLKRLVMGMLYLDVSLKPGETRELTPEEFALLKSK